MTGRDLILTAIYTLAALACVPAWRSAQRGGSAAEGRWWGVLAAVLLGLALIKLPLASGWTQGAREWAIGNGWYEGRRVIQAAALTILGGAGLVVAAILSRRAVRAGVPLAPVLGVVILVAHATVRASSFHYTDVLFGRAVAGVSLATADQAIGVLLVVVPAARAALNRRS